MATCFSGSQLHRNRNARILAQLHTGDCEATWFISTVHSKRLLGVVRRCHVLTVCK